MHTKKTKATVATYTATVSVRLTPVEAERLDDVSRKGHRTVSQTVRMLLESALHAPRRATEGLPA